MQVLDRKADPSNLFASPSFVPGRNLSFERKRQNHYINKALHINNPLSEAQKPRDSLNKDGGSIFPFQSERDHHHQHQQQQQQSDNPILQSVARQTLSQPNQFEPQPQNNTRTENNLEIRQPRYGLPDMPNARYTPQYQSNNQITSLNDRQLDERHSNQASTPQINSRGRGLSQSDEQNNPIFRSQADLKPNFNKDYLYLKSKHGIHANPVNIISNELKAPTAYLRNPYAHF